VRHCTFFTRYIFYTVLLSTIFIDYLSVWKTFAQPENEIFREENIKATILSVKVSLRNILLTWSPRELRPTLFHALRDIKSYIIEITSWKGERSEYSTFVFFSIFLWILIDTVVKQRRKIFIIDSIFLMTSLFSYNNL